MRVGVVSSSIYRCPPDAYGSESTTWDVADELDRRGHEVHLFAPPGSRVPNNGALHPIPFSHTVCSVTHEEMAARKYIDLVKTMDVVHDASATCRFADRLFHFEGKTNFIAVRNGIDSTFPVCGKNVVCLSKVQRDILTTARSPYKLSDARYVHYGVNTKFYSPEPREVLGLPDHLNDGEGYFLFLSRPHPSKGVDMVIRLAKEMPEERFIMAWKADAPDHVAWEREYLKMAEGVKNLFFMQLPGTGHHEYKRFLYAWAKALVVPLALDYVEAFGLVFIESLACGTPVITARHGSCPEVINHGETGFLCRTFDHYKAAVRGINHISRKRCREVAEQQYSRERMVDGYLRLYQDVMNGRCWGG